ncbi:hypothetical protein [Tardiphaga robiniae]|uniref:Uncharacterized protein n=1 Tax=Tardiphaga robiniae TaxID=943830 RepID=A0A7G6TWZ5_9BRAD|nr:hypothetical protein [Tardiphaga robiniae]QND71277.1 hypothetical protein HB776_08520 [Tardiphaga robiniae]
MAGRGKYFELLDFTKFAFPSVIGMDAAATANNLVERLGGGGFMSYGPIWSRLNPIVAGYATDAFIASEFSFHSEEWANDAMREVARLLRQYFNGRGRWFQYPQRPSKVLGFWFKPSIKGIWWVDGRAYAVLINARKQQPLFPDHLRFLARGVYELHCVEDPNDPTPLIIDLSEPQRKEGRILRAYEMPVEKAISLEEFEDAVRQFLTALQMAGVALPPEGADVVGLFKKR